jgi:hypothetical protein
MTYPVVIGGINGIAEFQSVSPSVTVDGADLVEDLLMFVMMFGGCFFKYFFNIYKPPPPTPLKAFYLNLKNTSHKILKPYVVSSARKTVQFYYT